MNENSHLLRQRSGDGHARVTFIELFFDLVFVFAVTQLSHLLLHALTPYGALQTLLLLFAVWWVWIFTSWVTNWLDPEETPVRMMLFALMLGGLVLASSIPAAFEERGLWFALAYVVMQVGRSCFMLWAVHGENSTHFQNFQRIASWLALSGVFWLAGGFASGEARLWLWVVATLVEFISPSVGFWVPGLGRSGTRDWDVAGEHIAERCGLFVIIALGESILVTGGTFAALERWTALNLTAFFVGFIGSIAMWWIYFNVGAERASRIITSSKDPGRLARLAYTYDHIVLVAGIIVSAVSDEIILKHPTGHTDPSAVLVVVGGPALFIAGCLLFKWATAGWPPLSHMVGLGLLAALFFIGPALSPLLLGIAANGVLVLVAAWETLSLPAQPREPELEDPALSDQPEQTLATSSKLTVS